MKIEQTNIKDLLNTSVFEDDRGYFLNHIIKHLKKKLGLI
jgi:hypothetical protein